MLPKVSSRICPNCPSLSQSAAGRSQRQEPWCRSICIRRVFAHEVRKSLLNAEHTTDNLFDKSKRTTPETTKYPLPPEGQRADEVYEGQTERDRYEQKLREKGAKYWEEGWYVWYSKSRWAAQEKVDLMMHDLPTQVGWWRHMAKQKEEWGKFNADGNAGWGDGEPPTMTIAPPPRSIPDPAKDSLLVHLPPPMPPIYEQMQNLLAPSVKVSNIFIESLHDGGQKEILSRLWEKAWSGDPWVLVGITVSRVKKMLKGDDDKD